MRVLRQILFQCLVLVLCVGLARGAAEQAQTEQAAAEAEKEAVPVIEIEEARYEFPQITQGEVVKHDFKVFNRGKAPLEIKRVKPG